MSALTVVRVLALIGGILCLYSAYLQVEEGLTLDEYLFLGEIGVGNANPVGWLFAMIGGLLSVYGAAAKSWGSCVVGGFAVMISPSLFGLLPLAAGLAMKPLVEERRWPFRY